MQEVIENLRYQYGEAERRAKRLDDAAELSEAEAAGHRAEAASQREFMQQVLRALETLQPGSQSGSKAAATPAVDHMRAVHDLVGRG